MRADRLVATLLVLQASGRVTAAELADELEVSVKTARRDLEALAIAGIPVYSQAGKGGGWQLLGGARTDLSGLTAAEARTLFLVAGPSSTATPEAKAALRKLVQALPETFRADAEAAASAVVLDPAGWGGSDRPPPPHLDELQRAVVDGVQVRLGYADRTRSETERVVHPLGLVEKDVVWYLVADTANGLRTFRVNRVRSRRAPPASRWCRPAGFDLADDVGRRRRRRSRRSGRRCAPLCVRMPAWGPYALRGQFGPSTTVVAPPPDDGRVDVEIGAPTHEYLAEQLAGWGDQLEVVEPDEVRDLLAAIGRQLVDRYGGRRESP